MAPPRAAATDYSIRTKTSSVKGERLNHVKAWVDGKLLPTASLPSISALDHGVIVGDGVFETVKVTDNIPFALGRHLDRLERSAVGLGLEAPDREYIRGGVRATLEGHPLRTGRVRITVTSGAGPLGSMRGREGCTNMVVAEPCAPAPRTTAVVTVPWVRNERSAVAGLKTTSYAENAFVLEHARRAGASEGLMPNSLGQLCEGTGSNVFYVLDGTVVTPSLKSGCLAGITRALVLEWCAGAVEIIERDLDITVLRDATEVFLTSTTRNVQAIHRLDGRDLPRTPVTASIAEIWERQSRRTAEP